METTLLLLHCFKQQINESTQKTIKVASPCYHTSTASPLLITGDFIANLHFWSSRASFSNIQFNRDKIDAIFSLLLLNSSFKPTNEEHFLSD